ncbi:DUF5074 domain-containing protein [Alkaliflexus imshenetskii]|uniref:DUF5074 domain-containing protein n=1 Tax=Alkaliflexus imshenetskii TaxID=286730 RepID=UPI0012FCB28A|nr:DUF5074 domain-containing protein [Alkaliflexus imshenetskii]
MRLTKVLQSAYLKLFMAVILASTVASCSDSDKETVRMRFVNGTLVLNEGSFMKANASISFISNETNEVTSEIFKLVNGSNAVLGDVLQDLVIKGSDAYIVMNNSHQIHIVDAETFEWKRTIDGLSSPRFGVIHGKNLFVTQWGENGSVVVIDTESMAIVKTIPVGSGPEGIIAHNNKIWVANSGGFGFDNTISVIDPATLEVEIVIETPDKPNHLTVDKNNNIWATCHGLVEYDESWNITNQTPSRLVKISSSSMQIEKDLLVSDSDHATKIDTSPDKSTIYVLNSSGIYSVDIDGTLFPSTPLVDGYFYSFNVNPTTGKIFTCDAGNWSSAGSIKIFNPETQEIEATITEGIGIGPNKLVFR